MAFHRWRRRTWGIGNRLGIPVLEVFVLGQSFFANFGQVLHLVSMLSVVPFMLLWRKDIESTLLHLLERKELNSVPFFKKIPTVLLLLLLLMNVCGTFKAIMLTHTYAGPIIERIDPPLGTAITQIPDHIRITFRAVPVQHSEQLITTSINYETKEPPTISANWLDERTMEISLSRPFQEKETLKLEYLLKFVIEDRLWFNEVAGVEYK